jgi:hypothetical protein
LNTNELLLVCFKPLTLKKSMEVQPQLIEFVKQNYSTEGLFCLALALFA